MVRGEVDGAVERSLVDAAYSGERLVSALRFAFCGLIAVRSIALWVGAPVPNDNPGDRALVTLPGIGIAMAFSAVVLLGAWRRHTITMIHASVAIDAVVAFVALLPNALWPPPHYSGIAYMMDTSSLFLVTMLTGLRHRPSAVILGGALNTISFALLVVVDLRVSGDTLYFHVGHATMYAVLILSVAAIAYVIARRTRTLIEAVTRAVFASTQASRGLQRVLRDHHDLRSAVASAQLNVGLVAEGEDTAFERLQADLVEVRTQLEQVKARALAEVAQVDGMAPASVGGAVEGVLAALQARFPDVGLAASGDLEAAVLVAGGDPTLRRIVMNLVLNACEGDGRRAARSVTVTSRRAGGRITLEIRDDGPGMPPPVLHAAPAEAMSTKLAGTGLGLGLVESLVRTSGGTVTWCNPAGGGALVTIELPHA